MKCKILKFPIKEVAQPKNLNDRVSNRLQEIGDFNVEEDDAIQNILDENYDGCLGLFGADEMPEILKVLFELDSLQHPTEASLRFMGGQLNKALKLLEEGVKDKFEEEIDLALNPMYRDGDY